MAEDVTVEFIRAIVENMQGAKDDWQTFAMVISIHNKLLSGTYGYAYNEQGEYYAVASRPSRLIDTFTSYINSYFAATERAPVKLLVEYDRLSGNYRLTFEDDDVDRWKVTPATVDTIIRELRPTFA